MWGWYNMDSCCVLAWVFLVWRCWWCVFLICLWGMGLVDLLAYVSRVEGLGAGLFLVGWCWWDLDLLRFSFCWGGLM